MPDRNNVDVLVIGGGFFGCYLACHAAKRGLRVLLAEARSELMQAASLVNQARIHNGYHYPRSILTGIRSQANFERFTAEFPAAAHADFTHLYAIAGQGGHITAQQFALFCDRIGAEYKEAGTKDASAFDRDRVEAVFRVKEWAFDAEALRQHMAAELARLDVDVHLDTRVLRAVSAGPAALEATLSSGQVVHAAMALNCTYAELNTVAKGSATPLLPLKQELVEIALMDVPPELDRLGWTIMDGPFCSSLPFPARKSRSLYHVRYSTHGHWMEGGEGPAHDVLGLLEGEMPRTHFQHMVHDGERFVPALRKARYAGSLWTVRTKLPGSAQTDSRPILFRQAPHLQDMYHVLGGKMDNVFDLEPYLDEALDARSMRTPPVI
ncbi:MAG: FAD-binding oxidoreductase [Flavobacteriales bacterium]|nr:FAD-binding oxidoreductase [Flavobacteriales bacterium]